MTSKSKFLEHLLATAQSRLNIGFSSLIDIDAYVELTLFKLKIKYKVNIMVQRSVILLLMMVVFVGCGEDEPDKVKPKVVDDVADEGPMKRILWETDGAKMALIPAGSFEMCNSSDKPEHWMMRSRPVHTVELDAFYIDNHH